MQQKWQRRTGCKWEGSTLDYMSPSRGVRELKESYPIHSCYRNDETEQEQEQQ